MQTRPAENARLAEESRPPVLPSEVPILSIMREITASYLKVITVAWIMTFILSSAAEAQVLPTVNTVFAQQETTASENSDIQLNLEANSRLGGLTYVPGHWGEFQLRLDNGGNETRELLCTSYFDGLPGLQYGRKLWLPAKSQLSLSHPVLIPSADQISESNVLVRSLLVDESQGQEVLLKNRSGQLQHDRTLRIDSTERHTGIIAGWGANDVVPQDVLDLVVANRVYQGINNRVTYLPGEFLPADETSLNYLDHLVLVDDRLIHDQAALAAVRRWLYAGGRLWILVDRTGPTLLEQVLGDEFRGTVIDRVGLSSVQIETPQVIGNPEEVVSEPVEFDTPVEFVRMVSSDFTVRNTVNGWPASLTRSYGTGRILITTLGPRAWMKPTPPVPAKDPPNDETPEEKQAREARELELRSEFTPVSQMEDLAPYIFARRDPEPLPPESLEPFAQEFISYEVPTGTLIIGSMAGFLVLLAVIGTLLARWGKLEHFGWCGSLLAAVFGALFLGIGISNRHSTVETIASIQLAEAIGGSDDVLSHGVLGVYRPEGSGSVIATSHGGVLWPDVSGTDGTTRRMVTTDLGTFHWAGLTQPAGLAMYPVATSGTFPNRMEAQGTLDAQGITGRYIGQAAEAADAVLATHQGRIGVQLEPDGRFTALAADVMQPDQYLDSTFLTDVQNRRQRMLEALFASETWTHSLDQPQLLLWVNDWNYGFNFGDDLQRQGDTLLTVPLQLTRPPANTEILVPSPLLSYSTCLPPDGSSPSGFWDGREWQERSSPSTTWLNVHIPKSLLPLQASKLQIEVMVSGLMGQIEILGVNEGRVISVEKVTDPVGKLLFEIVDPGVLTVSDDGELTIGLSAGVQADDANPSAGATGNLNSSTPVDYWRVQSMAVQLWAVTIESAERTNE
ncbi:MAG: hypothetical protein KDA52_13875 [Planctomycetaceae bacterium]|nr:hypothetical protein [Planctomycetaceae bacterium]